MVIKHDKDYEKAESILASITDNLTLWDIEILWCLVIIKRNAGHRLKSSKRLGISYRTLRSYGYILKEHGFDVPTFSQRNTKKERCLHAVR